MSSANYMLQISHCSPHSNFKCTFHYLSFLYIIYYCYNINTTIIYCIIIYRQLGWLDPKTYFFYYYYYIIFCNLLLFFVINLLIIISLLCIDSCYCSLIPLILILSPSPTTRNWSPIHCQRDWLGLHKLFLITWYWSPWLGLPNGWYAASQGGSDRYEGRTHACIFKEEDRPRWA